MSWRLAESLKKLREQINAAFPKRDKTSDGSIGDAGHSARKSDHNPNARGVVTAVDIDEDLNANGVTLEDVITAIRKSKDPRVKYIIYEGRITVAGSQLQRWKKYTGKNSHSHHAHISVSSDPKLYDDTAAWQIDSTAVIDKTPLATSDKEGNANSDPLNKPPSILQRGSKGAKVKQLQTALNAHGYKLKADGDFGAGTERAVRSFQNTTGLRPDGLAGSKTLKELGL